MGLLAVVDDVEGVDQFLELGDRRGQRLSAERRTVLPVRWRWPQKTAQRPQRGSVTGTGSLRGASALSPLLSGRRRRIARPLRAASASIGMGCRGAGVVAYTKRWPVRDHRVVLENHRQHLSDDGGTTLVSSIPTRSRTTRAASTARRRKQGFSVPADGLLSSDHRRLAQGFGLGGPFRGGRHPRCWAPASQRQFLSWAYFQPFAARRVTATLVTDRALRLASSGPCGWVRRAWPRSRIHAPQSS